GAEETHRMIERIGKIERDRSVGAQTQECSRGAIGRSRQLQIADAAVTIFQRRAVAELRDRAIEQLPYRRGRNRRAPAPLSRPIERRLTPSRALAPTISASTFGSGRGERDPAS